MMRLTCQKCGAVFVGVPMEAPGFADVLRLYLPDDTSEVRITQGFTHVNHLRCPGLCRGELKIDADE